MSPIEVRGADPLALAVAAAIHVTGDAAPKQDHEFHMQFHTGLGPFDQLCWFMADICGSCRLMLGLECSCADPELAPTGTEWW